MENDFSLFLRGRDWPCFIVWLLSCLMYSLTWVVRWLVFKNPSVYRDSVPEFKYLIQRVDVSKALHFGQGKRKDSCDGRDTYRIAGGGGNMLHH